MKTIRKKSAGWKGAAWLLCLSMLMTAVEPLAVQAEETIDVSSVIASETTEQTASEEAGQAALEETEQTVSGDVGEDVLSEIESDTFISRCLRWCSFFCYETAMVCPIIFGYETCQ